jgi:hypothetical protein
VFVSIDFGSSSQETVRQGQKMKKDAVREWDNLLKLISNANNDNNLFKGQSPGSEVCREENIEAMLLRVVLSRGHIGKLGCNTTGFKNILQGGRWWNDPLIGKIVLGESKLHWQQWMCIAPDILVFLWAPENCPREGDHADPQLLILFLFPSSAKELYAHLDSFRQAI